MENIAQNINFTRKVWCFTSFSQVGKFFPGLKNTGFYHRIYRKWEKPYRPCFLVVLPTFKTYQSQPKISVAEL